MKRLNLFAAYDLILFATVLLFLVSILNGRWSTAVAVISSGVLVLAILATVGKRNGAQFGSYVLSLVKRNGRSGRGASR